MCQKKNPQTVRGRDYRQFETRRQIGNAWFRRIVWRVFRKRIGMWRTACNICWHRVQNWGYLVRDLLYRICSDRKKKEESGNEVEARNEEKGIHQRQDAQCWRQNSMVPPTIARDGLQEIGAPDLDGSPQSQIPTQVWVTDEGKDGCLWNEFPKVLNNLLKCLAGVLRLSILCALSKATKRWDEVLGPV